MFLCVGEKFCLLVFGWLLGDVVVEVGGGVVKLGCVFVELFVVCL